ncbi:hypothetical protein KPH14_013074 [Odynerus spinipes]|uniref:MSV199 domain-containing protein n=1 Tax=Odynerus spinipes TaxID=1348599 RepID=A0AAD9R828_9HYME|nr:hypothetical protein KPH14_013074 [Odynerus spinipes]
MSSTTILLNKHVDVRSWISPIKLTYSEVCLKYGVDIENDRKNAFFWNMSMGDKVIVNDDLLTWCGYSGQYKNQKNNFTQLLKKNPQILYNEIKDEKNPRKSYIVLDTLGFESLLMQMRSPKAREIRELYYYFRHISTQYMKYEKYFEKHINEIIMGQNKHLMDYAERSEAREKEITNKLEKMSNKIDDIKTNVSVKIVNQLREEVSPLVAPEPINTKKERCLALINTKPGHEWYIVRRQRETFNSAIDKVLKKYEKEKPSVVKRWYKISHSVDVGNSLKNRLRNLRWMARGNILSAIDRDAGPSYSNDVLVQAIEDILSKNIATTLSDVTKKLID